MTRFVALLCLSSMILLSACSGPSYTYQYIPGKTGVLHQGYAYPPPEAPPRVHVAMAAANRIAGLPYRHGGGHTFGIDTGYDCSGAASYVLRESGLLRDSMPSKGFRRYGASGEGDWISLYAKSGHVFLVIAGLRFDTGWTNAPEGPQWTMMSRPASGCVIRHPEGL